MEPVELSAGPFTLRPPRGDDAAWIFDAVQDPDISRFTRLPRPYRAVDAARFIERAATDRRTDVAWSLVIELTETGELLGACGLVRIDDETVEVGYWLALDGRGRGAATAAVTALVGFAEASLGALRCRAIVHLDNALSERVLSRCGFVCVDRQSTCEMSGGSVAASRWERDC
jgi:RimJ/RimL family protein N-acetyltransferase